MSQVSGKDITELIAAGREKLASVPAGGGAAVAVSGAAAGAGAAPAAAESKKEEKVEEKEESDDVIFLSFGSITLNLPNFVHFSLVYVKIHCINGVKCWLNYSHRTCSTVFSRTLFKFLVGQSFCLIIDGCAMTSCFLLKLTSFRSIVFVSHILPVL